METKKRFVAMLDIMGSSKIVEKDPDALGRIMCECKKLIQDYRSSSNVYISLFSDSIMVLTKDDEASSFEDLVYATAVLERMFIQNTFAINGAISYGDITVEEDTDFIFYGKPVIDAHKIQEELLFYGIVIDESAIEKMYSYNEALFCVSLSGEWSHPDMVIEMMCPYKSKGWQMRFAVNWMDLCVLDKERGGFVTYSEQIPQMKEYMAKLYKKYVCNDEYGGRANFYVLNTELMLRQWYDFTGEKNGSNKWGTLIADLFLLQVPK